jgi:hypothetical protein
MKAGWIGQMAGVGLAKSTEFRFMGELIPEDRVPAWTPEMVNQFDQDDLYVEMTFVRTLEQYGLDVSSRQAGIDFANTTYLLRRGDAMGRNNLRNGIAPPDSGHPKFNGHADDIDYQNQGDYAGLISPGLPNSVVRLGETFGRLMHYDGGVYGGQFVGGMYAEAFFETDMVRIVEAGLACVPAKSQFAECIRDVLKWYKTNPSDWQKTWALIEEKYNDNPAYRRFSCSRGDHNIDAKMNAAYIVMGLLYGEGDIDKTIIISTRCGQDSDCNPANSGGILCTTIGFSKLPDKFKSALNPEGKFSHTPYNFPTLIKVSQKIARQAVRQAGGQIMHYDINHSGIDVFVIPVQQPEPSKLEQCWEPGPVANSRFTEAEMEKIAIGAVDVSAGVKKVAPGWKVSKCGSDMGPGLKAEWNGRKSVLMTHPLNRNTGCVLSKTVKIRQGGQTKLSVWVSHHPKGDWDLIIRGNGEQLFRGSIGKETADNGWVQVEVDLTKYAGKEVKLELVNEPTGWSFEAAYWGKIEIKRRFNG